MKQCSDGHCVAVYFFCDGKNDCGDWTDEMNCTGTVSSVMILYFYKLNYLNKTQFIGGINHELPSRHIPL